MGRSNISWCHYVQNYWIGCFKVSIGCKFCWAETQQDKLYHRVKWGKGNPRVKTKTWGEPLKWNREADERGVRFRVFTNSLSDMFDEEVDDQWRDEAFQVIKACPNLDWLILTKRPQKAHDYLYKLSGWPFENVWLGVSVENQEAADYRIPILQSIPANIRFLSCEPLLECIDFGKFLSLGEKGKQDKNIIDWVIVGGESGPGFRNMRTEWAQNLFDQCQAAKVAFYCKQDSSLYNESKGKLPDGLWSVKEFPR